jgi:hypothetical protein
MAGFRYGIDESFVANADLSSYRFRFVNAGSVANEVKLATVASGSVLGVLQNNPKQGEEAVVRIWGFSRIVANADAAAVVVGGYVSAASDSKVCGATLSSCAFVVGTAMNAIASGSVAEIEILLGVPYYKNAS